MPRWYSVLPGFLRNTSCVLALSIGRGAAVQPIIFSKAGLTKAKKVTMTATGLPGSPNKTAERWPF